MNNSVAHSTTNQEVLPFRTDQRSIVFVTGTRADFGKMEPLALAAHKQGFKVTFFITGMHMMEKYGLTKAEVQLSGLNTYEFLNQRDGDPQDTILTKTVSGFSDFIKEIKPDLVVIHGDRVEALAASLVCTMNYVLCAHVEGGELSGTIDDTFRHCTTKLSNIHLVSSEDARTRVLRLGESDESVMVIGSPELDVHKLTSGLELEDVLSHYDIATKDYGICIFHPVTSEKNSMKQQATALFENLAASGRYFVVIMPNNDPGSDDILEIMYKMSPTQFRLLPSMRFKYFSELIKNAKVMVGNSSAGVREAPYLGVPSLNVGTRQQNRASANSITSVNAFDDNQINTFLDVEWGKRYCADNSFGEGLAVNKFEKLINSKAFWTQPKQKYFSEDFQGE